MSPTGAPRRRGAGFAGAFIGLTLSLGAAGAPRTDAPALRVCADPDNLPFSNDREAGFENRIAKVLADELGATLSYAWSVQRRGFLRRTLLAGVCDVVVGLPEGLPNVRLTRPFYSADYVFVTRKDRHLRPTGFDDPALPGLRIGLQMVGAEGATTPPASSLALRGIVSNVVGYGMWRDRAGDSPQAGMIDAVASGVLDVAIVWGPIASYFSRQRAPGALAFTAVAADPRLSGLAFHYALALATRTGDADLSERLQRALDARRRDIDDILRAEGIATADAKRDGVDALPTRTSTSGPPAAKPGD